MAMAVSRLPVVLALTLVGLILLHESDGGRHGGSESWGGAPVGDHRLAATLLRRKDAQRAKRERMPISRRKGVVENTFLRLQRLRGGNGVGFDRNGCGAIPPKSDQDNASCPRDKCDDEAGARFSLLRFLGYDTDTDLPKNYDRSVEPKVQEWWEAHRCFEPREGEQQQMCAEKRRNYTIPMPPPNVTG
eukprot:jgi/Bigna1/127207/aug1.4_g1915